MKGRIRMGIAGVILGFCVWGLMIGIFVAF